MPVPALLTAAVIAVTPAVPAYEPEGCEHIRPSRKASEGLTRALREPYVNKRRVVDLWRCVETRPKAHRLHARAHRLWGWRHSYPQIWRIRFDRLPAYDQAWARSTSSCEAGMNPSTNTGNGFYGAFQFVSSTWYAAGGDRPPTSASWEHQAVIAVRWRNKAGAGQWPVCGH